MFSTGAEFEVVVAEHRRAAILWFLHEQPSFRSNDGVLQDMLEVVGLATSRDLVRTELGWLAEQGLLAQQSIADAVVVVTLTQRGVDCARGRTIVAGVRRPDPRP